MFLETPGALIAHEPAVVDVLESKRESAERANSACCGNSAVGSDHVRPHSTGYPQKGAVGVERVIQAVNEMDRDYCLTIGPVRKNVM